MIWGCYFGENMVDLRSVEEITPGNRKMPVWMKDEDML